MAALELPGVGMGTWHMGESGRERAAEVEALTLGLDLGLVLIDTAEMYGDGGAEKVVGAALRGRRDGAFVVSKFYPHHASRSKLFAACDASLARLGIDVLDLYLYHWRGNTPLAETVAALEELVASGRIRRWGVSNFDVADLEELVSVPGGQNVAANQVLYNLQRRGIEFDLLPWCRERAIAVMAYSPLDEGPLAHHPKLATLARTLGVTPAQVAIAWAAREACAIPKAATAAHVRDNRAAADIRMDAVMLASLDAIFPPPRRKQPLAII